MSERQETVREVCAEAKGRSWVCYWNESGKPMEDFIASMEAAYKREIAAKDAEIERLTVAQNAQVDTMQSRIDEMVEIVAEKDAEIVSHKRCYHALEVHCKQLEDEYLKAMKALKPVLACNEESCRAFGDHYLMLDNAVREAQRIMKEGCEK